MVRGKRVGRMAAQGVAVLMTAAIAACGGTTDSGSAQRDAPAGEGKPLAFFEERLEQLRAGASYTRPTGGGPVPAPGKKIWAIIYGLGTSASDEAARGLKQAAADIGWDVRIYDGRFDTNRYVDGIRQAISDRADGIYLYIIDCPLVQTALQQARSAGIPVVAGESLDCNEVRPGAPRLFTSDIGAYNGGPYHEGRHVGYATWIENFGRAQTDSIIVATRGKAKVIDFFWTDSESTRIQERGFRKEIALCSECEVVDTIRFTAADIGTSLQQKAAQALLRNPDANAIFGVYDAAITGGIAAAVRASPRASEIFVAGGEGNPPNVEFVREGVGQNSGVLTPVRWESYAALDAFNRIFNDEGTAEPNGIGMLVWDRDHNLPDPGEFVPVPADYRSVYLESWGR